MTTDGLEAFKRTQRQSWAHFAPLEAQTTPTAAQLVKHAKVRAGQRVLDVGCGTGVVALTAARIGASVTTLDLTPELLARARENAEMANLHVDWHEGDVEQLPFEPESFDVVMSQFGHMFAPRPEVAVSEMLRVLRRGGTIAFSTWPPELLVGRRFSLAAKYLPPPPIQAAPPPLWGDPAVIRERLGSGVKDITFDRGRMLVPALTVTHHRATFERMAGPILRVVELLSTSDPARLEEFRRETETLIAEYFEDNLVHQDYLMTRATKV
jgi:SAM-dependent methyltransferase